MLLPGLWRRGNPSGALPVVLPDGFDELLQATGVSRSDYLEQVRDLRGPPFSRGIHPKVPLRRRRQRTRHRYPRGWYGFDDPFAHEQTT
jgi:hypothetical protein